MPIYDFKCTNCGFKDELMRKISESIQTACPECGKDTFAKMLSAPSFQLSGTGWYASDFKDKKTNIGDNKIEKSEVKTTDKEPNVESKAAACNPGCACH
jgi:putative FmdB family regulatory protein